MRITKYTTKINRETMRTELVKEKAVNYKAYKKLSNPQLIVNALNDLFDMQNMAEEYIYMLTLNTKSDITGIFEIAHGTIDSCITSPREIFNKALLVGATGLILVHNHPSGYVEASVHDTTLTRRIKESGKLLNVELLDHIIIGDNCYYSFCEDGILDNL